MRLLVKILISSELRQIRIFFSNIVLPSFASSVSERRLLDKCAKKSHIFVPNLSPILLKNPLFFVFFCRLYAPVNGLESRFKKRYNHWNHALSVAIKQPGTRQHSEPISGGDGENRTRVRKHFHRSFSERSFCFRVSLLKTPKSRLFRRLSCYSPMLPGIHIEFSCIVVAGHPAYRWAGADMHSLWPPYAAIAIGAKLLFFLAFIFNVSFLTQTGQTAARFSGFHTPVETKDIPI